MVDKNPKIKRGQDHYRASLTDHEVELLRKLHDEGLGYKKLAKKFDTPVRTVRGICNYETR